MLYIILRGHWCDINVLNVHDTIDTTDNTKDSFNEELECVCGKFPEYHTKIF
jgi:hypothetical protein